jgi:hypothetical protein
VTVLKGFEKVLGQYLSSSWGFVFTVAGTIVGLVLAGQHWWIAVLIVVANALACGCFAYVKHLGEAKARDEQKTTALKLDEAERKLNEVPLELLAQVNELVNSDSFAAFARLLAESVDVIARHKQFFQLVGKPLAITTFAKPDDHLFVLAKASAEALQQLRVGDTFLLVKKTPSGVEITVANLAVHQQPDLKKEVAYLVVLGPIPPALEPMVGLANQGDMARIRGYSVRPAYDVSRYEEIDLVSVSEAIALLIGDIANRVPGVST